MDTEQGTRKNDSIDATQDATTHYPDKKEIQKNLRNKILSPKTKIGKLTPPICVALMTKAEMGQSTKSQDDVDSEVIFEEDPDEEIDTLAIEEEDWIEYMKMSTVDALDKMERAKIRCWNRTHKKMKWKLALGIATTPSERWLKKAAEWNPDLSFKI